jgi:hypothetical protein
MSILCDIFVASEQDALLYPSLIAEGREIAAPRFAVASFSGLTPDSFNHLATLLPAMQEVRASNHIAHEDSGEWWLEQFSSEFIDAVCAIDDALKSSIASKWTEIDETIFSVEHASDVLESVQQLCRKSTAHQLVFLWGSI